MKRFGVPILTLLLCTAFAVCSVWAAEEEPDQPLSRRAERQRALFERKGTQGRRPAVEAMPEPILEPVQEEEPSSGGTPEPRRALFERKGTQERRPAVEAMPEPILEPAQDEEPSSGGTPELRRALFERKGTQERRAAVEAMPEPIFQPKRKVEGLPEPSEDQVTQAELAEILVRVLGLSRFLAPASTPFENIEVLLENLVQPGEGWQLDAVVTPVVLARVIVQAMKMQNEIDNPDDPMAWIIYLQTIGVFPEDLRELTIGEATGELDPAVEPVAPNVFVVSTTTDPLKKHQKFGEPDEREYGTDQEFVATERPVNFARPEEEPVARVSIRRVFRRAAFRPIRLPPATPT